MTTTSPAAARLERADRRRAAGNGLLDALGLFDRWRPYGDPVLVGSMALGLVVEPDIDLEIYSDAPSVEQGFAALAPCAALPGVRGLRFANCLDLEDRGLYWRLDVESGAGRGGGEGDGDGPGTSDGTTWQIDMWWLPTDHPGPRAADLVAPVRAALTADSRNAVLTVKEGAREAGEPLPGVRVYEAVLDHGVRSYPEFTAWRDRTGADGLTHWRPSTTAAR